MKNMKLVVSILRQLLKFVFTSSLGHLFVFTSAYVLLFRGGVACVVIGVSSPFFLLNIMKHNSPAFLRKTFRPS